MTESSVSHKIVDRALSGRVRCWIDRALDIALEQLPMEVAYASRISGETSIVCGVTGRAGDQSIKVGQSHNLSEVYCGLVIDGHLPEIIPDTRNEPLAVGMRMTEAASIRSHLGVPIRLSDGQIYGMLACFRSQPNPSLTQSDLRVMRVLADLVAFEIDQHRDFENNLQGKVNRIKAVLENDELSIAYQPIWDTDTMLPIGFECLSRFPTTPVRSPDKWFAEAADVGMGTKLELKAIETALSSWTEFPSHMDFSVNASPETIIDDAFVALLESFPLTRLILEITEHSNVADYRKLLQKLKPLQNRGLRLAIDDAGAGYSSLALILQLRPDYIKLDISLTRNIDRHAGRRALASALIRFADETGSRIVAEGVERQSELETLRSLGVKKVQGYLLGRPTSLAAARLLCFNGPVFEQAGTMSRSANDA